MSQHWKNIERRKCRDMGGQRKPQITEQGFARGSDDDGTIWCSLEVKYVNRYMLPGRWVKQARANGAEDGRPWVLAVEERYDKGSGLFICEWDIGVELAKGAGLVPLPATTGSAERATPGRRSTSKRTWPA